MGKVGEGYRFRKRMGRGRERKSRIIKIERCIKSKKKEEKEETKDLEKG